MNVSIKGLDEILKKLGPAIVQEPLENFFKRAAIKVQSSARQKTPVDTGGERNRLMYEVSTDNARVGFLDASPGSELFYQARAMEYGTGRMGDPAVSHSATHFPPGPKLELWAARHGFQSGWQVAKIIARRGGLKPRHMLKDGLAESMSALQGFANQLGKEIAERWSK